MKELSPDINWDKAIEEFDQERLEQTIADVLAIRDLEQIHIDEVVSKVNEANDAIRSTSFDFKTGEFDPVLYDTYKFRLFVKGGRVTIAQGRPYNPETGEWKE